MNRNDLRKLRAQVEAMPKCPTCGGFAIPSTTGGGRFVCKDHGVFVASKGR